jgi:hypothetical protein
MHGTITEKMKADAHGPRGALKHRKRHILDVEAVRRLLFVSVLSQRRRSVIKPYQRGYLKRSHDSDHQYAAAFNRHRPGIFF